MHQPRYLFCRGSQVKFQPDPDATRQTAPFFCEYEYSRHRICHELRIKRTGDGRRCVTGRQVGHIGPHHRRPCTLRLVSVATSRARAPWTAVSATCTWSLEKGDRIIGADADRAVAGARPWGWEDARRAGPSACMPLCGGSRVPAGRCRRARSSSTQEQRRKNLTSVSVLKARSARSKGPSPSSGAGEGGGGSQPKYSYNDTVSILISFSLNKSFYSILLLMSCTPFSLCL